MNKIKVLDLTIIELNKLTCSGVLTPIEDLQLNLNIEKHGLLRALDYLCILGYCEKINNAYQITFAGEHFISKNTFIIKTKPFTFEYYYKQLKVIALVLNTLMILSIGWLNYSVNKSRNNYQKVDSKVVSNMIDSTSRLNSNVSKPTKFTIDTLKTSTFK
jgi:hypothetical protein